MAQRDLNPKCEDYNSDDSDHGVVLDEDFRTSPVPTANVAAKRSPSAELGKSAMDGLPSDMQSDSGYSSHTAATMASADSGPSARSPPTAPTSAAPIPPPSPAVGPTRRRQTLVPEDRHQTSQSSPRKPLQRAPSSASKRPSTNRRPSTTVTTESVDCADPNCRECGPNALAYRNRRPDSALDVSYPQAYDVRSQHSEPTPSTTYTFPSSPTFGRQPAPYAQGSAVVQPAQTRRRSSSTTGPRRPATYYSEGQAYYGQGAMSGGYPGTPQEHGPPPTLARYNMPPPHMQHPQAQHPHMSPYMMPSAAPYYPNGQPMAHQTSPPYEQQRPTLSARNSSHQNYQARVSGYGPAQVIQQDRSAEQMPSARYSNVPKGAGREELRDEEDSESSESEYSSGEDVQPHHVRVRELMPPPSKPKSSSKDGRPPMRKAKTTATVINDGRNGRRGSISHSQQDRRRDSTAHTRAPSTHRPPLVQTPKAVSFPRTSKANVVVENSKTQRRRSYQQPYESDYDMEPRLRRSSKVYRDDYEYEEVDRKRNSRTPKPYHDDQYEREVERKRNSRTPKLYHDDQYEREIEHKRSNRNSKLYQDVQQFELESKRRNRESKVYLNEPQPESERRRRPHRDSVLFSDYDEESIEPLAGRPRRGTDAPATKRDNYPERKDRHKASEAEAYQQRTRGSNDPLNDLVHKAALKKQSRVPSDGASSRSDDKKSRVSRAPTSMTSGGNGEIRLRVDASAPISVSLNGDMNGRTLQVVPGEDGMADIVIGGQDHEAVYRSERGSVLGGHRKSITATPHPRRDAEEQSVRSSRSSNTRREAERREAERPTRGGGVLRRRTDFN